MNPLIELKNLTFNSNKKTILDIPEFKFMKENFSG